MIGAITAGLLAGGVAASTNSYESISTVTVGAGGAASVSFSSIPSTFKHLQLRGIAVTAISGKLLTLQANSDTTAGNYVSHLLSGEGTTAKSSAFTTSQTYSRFFGLDVGTSTTNPTAFIMDILDYASANKNKTLRTLSGMEANGSGEIELYSGLWLNSSTAVTSLTIKTQDSTNFAQYSSFALYGIKG